jgi:hypothetical protein
MGSAGTKSLRCPNLHRINRTPMSQKFLLKGDMLTNGERLFPFQAEPTHNKFRHTYATRLLESGCDIVTVQKLMGHSDIDTTRQYLDPDEALKRKAVNRLSLTQK